MCYMSPCQWLQLVLLLFILLDIIYFPSEEFEQDVFLFPGKDTSDKVIRLYYMLTLRQRTRVTKKFNKW